jgi:hypothetical protein
MIRYVKFVTDVELVFCGFQCACACEADRSHMEFLFTPFHQKTLSAVLLELSKLHNVLPRIPGVISPKMEQCE